MLHDTNREPIDSWDPFNWAPRKSAFQALYVAITISAAAWTGMSALLVFLLTH